MKISSIFHDLGRAFALIKPVYRRQFLWIGVVSVLASLLEATGVSMVFGLIQVILDPSLIERAPVLKSALDRLGVGLTHEIMLFGAIAIGLFFLVKNAFLVFVTYFQQNFTYMLSAEIAHELMRRYLLSPYELMFERNSADLIIGVNQTSYFVATRIFGPAAAMLTESLIIIAVFGVLLLAEPAATISAALFFLTFLTVYHWIIGKKYPVWGERQLVLERGQTKFVYESLSCLKETKVLGRESFFIRNFFDFRLQSSRLSALVATVNVLPRMVTETAIIWGVVVVVAMVLSTDQPSPSAISTLGLFAFAGFRIMPSTNRFTTALASFKHGIPSLERIVTDFSYFPSVSETPDAKAAEAGDILFESEITLDDVSYAYPGTGRQVLSGITLSVRKGETVGIVGETGAGKTTLVDIFLGLLAPTEGKLFIDGRPLDTTSDAWKQLIGYVPQDITLTDDTLRHNIALGLANDRIKDEKIGPAVRLAALESVVGNLPNKLETVVGERGVRLSGGQRQRIGIARALYHEPEILVLDEPTSSLDTETEKEIMAAIDSLTGAKTILIIAHRLSTVRHCNKILFLKDGGLAASGTFDEVCAKSPDFARMVALAEISGGEDSLIDETGADD